MERAYRTSAQAIALLLLIIGVAMVATTLARGGGVLAFGVVLGVLFALAGAGRLAIARGGVRPDRRAR